jgi:hypothetical protein
MAFSSKHNRNARRGQSLFTAARRPWPFFVARRRVKGAFFVRTPAWGPEGGTRAVRHAAARSSARAEEGISIPRALVLLLGAKPAGWTAASAALQRGAWGSPGAWSAPERTPRLGRPASSLPACFFQGLSQAWHIADTQGSRRPWQATRGSRDTTVRTACHGEHEGYYGNHDDARFITRA